jgi:hypothetical protein
MQRTCSSDVSAAVLLRLLLPFLPFLLFLTAAALQAALPPVALPLTSFSTHPALTTFSTTATASVGSSNCY